MYYLKSSALWFFINFVVCMGQLSGITREDRQVFDTWLSSSEGYAQQVFPQIDLTSLLNRDAGLAGQAMVSRYKRFKNDLGDFDFYFSKLLNGLPFEKNVQPVVEHTKALYPLLENNVHKFLQHLVKAGFAKLSIDRKERKDPDSDDSMNKYLALMRLFFADHMRLQERKSLFTVANNFFEYCFSPKTFSSFKQLLRHRRYHPVARLLYSVMWNHLSGEGWKEWHESCLQELKKAADQNKTVVYIAGGCDIYQLIKHGIYNVRIIDPMLPTQPPYYAQHWSWFLKKGSLELSDGQKDRLQFTFGDGSTYMERTAHEQKGYFTFKTPKGKKCKIPSTETTWSVYSNNKLVGNVVFDRRYCRQSDFEYSPEKQLLVSFNELYFITSVGEPEHWGIFPNKFHKNLSVLVKQLRKPLSKTVMCNIAKSNRLPFEFIQLGTCAVFDET